MVSSGAGVVGGGSSQGIEASGPSSDIRTSMLASPQGASVLKR